MSTMNLLAETTPTPARLSVTRSSVVSPAPKTESVGATLIPERRRRLFRTTTACLTLLLSIATAASADARVFYVSPRGHNHRSGRSPAAAWRTVARVNHARLRPGDVVEFQGGAVFSDAQLIPHNSGRPAAPILFTSHGRGRATLTRGVWLTSIRWIGIVGLRLTRAENGVGSGYGSGSTHVAVVNNVISGVGVAVNASNPADYGWWIAANRIDHTRDSGVITLGAAADIAANQITNTGTDAAIHYDKHGIYSKGPDARILANTIANFSAQGVSTRFRGAFISGNLIESGQAGVGYWQDDAHGGTTVVCGNTIARVHYGVLIGPQSGHSKERFRILDNHISTTGGPGVYDPYGRAAVSFSKNIVSIKHASDSQTRPAQACPQSHLAASDRADTASVRGGVSLVTESVLAISGPTQLLG